MKPPNPIKLEKLLVFLFVLAAAVLLFKYVKQFIYLSFTLLSLKFVWVILVVLAVLILLKKRL